MSLVSSPEAIWKLIPQQPPFVLVDEIVAYGTDCLVAGFKIPDNHVLVDKRGFLTESGVIEHFAQAIALHQGYDYFLRDMPPPVGYIGSIKDFEIHQLPRIGNELRTHITILQQLFGVTAVRGEVTLQGHTIALGEMRTVIAS